jgi:hypothetical protein
MTSMFIHLFYHVLIFIVIIFIPVTRVDVIVSSCRGVLPGRRKDTHVVRLPGSIAQKDVMISRAMGTTFHLCDRIGALRIDHVANCRIYVGAVAGSVHLEDATDCVLVLASRQIRIHAAHRCDFYLHVQSNPIIEHSDTLRFAPYNLSYPEQASHAQVPHLPPPPPSPFSPDIH